MRRLYSFIFFVSICISSCEDFGNLTAIANVPESLKEVSGMQYDAKRNAFWMINDQGNSSILYLVNERGFILKELDIGAQNHDWEEVTMSANGDLYIGDFGNNLNKRKNLQILKVNQQDLNSSEEIQVETINFYFPEQTEFPPQKMYYDVEAFFEWNNQFYLFTKSRVKKEIGRTFLYRVPNQKGNHAAIRISEFTTCKKMHCAITAADINNDGTKVVLLNHKSAWIFTNFKGDDFFSGDAQKIRFLHVSQKESITFTDDSTLYIADEKTRFSGGNLYRIELK
jgi:hypothetical protein